MSAPVQTSSREPERLSALERYQILDTPPEPSYDEIVQLAADICQVPISQISLIDRERAWSKARVGLDVTEIPREQAFCSYAILEPNPLIVTDLSSDERFSSNPLVSDSPHFRFYAGVPLQTTDGHGIGTLCVLDKKPRQLSDYQRKALETLANQVMQLMEQRRYVLAQENLLAQISRQHLQLQDVYLINMRLSELLSAHLQEPIDNMHLMLQVLDQQGQLNPQLQQGVRTLQTQVQDTRQALDHFGRWQRLQKNNFPPRSQPLQLADLVRATAGRCKDLANRKQIQVEISIPDTVLLNAPLEPLRFIIGSLIHNGLKYSSDNSRLQISLKDEKTLVVSDLGPGLTQTEMQELGTHLPETVKPGTNGEKGLGLGLLISSHYAAQMGASISFSNLNPGCQAKLQLP